MREAGHVARVGGKRGAYMGVPEGKRPLVKLGRKWEDNINMDLK
jgi:hypothetical protein